MFRRFTDQAKQGSAAFWGLACGQFLARIAGQGADLLTVGTGVFQQETTQTVGFVFNQLIAPSFELMKKGVVGIVAGLPLAQLFGNRFGIETPHQPSDVLHLATQPAIGVNASGFVDSLTQVVWQIKSVQLFARQFNQRLAEFLQVVHPALELTFAGRLADGVKFIHVAQNGGKCCYDSAFTIAQLIGVFVSEQFSHDRAQLMSLVEEMLAYAGQRGATACAAEASSGIGQSVTVRQGEVETIEYNRDKGISVTVYQGRRRGHASTSDFGRDALHAAVDKALTIASYTAEDECAGLPDQDMLAQDVPDLDLFHPWEQGVNEAIAMAGECESAAMAVDPRITNSEGASVSTQQSLFVFGNSLGFIGGYPSTRHGISCAVIAESEQGMQRDYWYSSARFAGDLDPAGDVGRRAGQRTIRRLDARRLSTCEAPVLFEAPVASGLISHFVTAISGGHLYRKSSYLLDSLGTAVFPEWVNIVERPHLPRALASSPFDNEGVRTMDRDVVQQGRVAAYFLSSYSARKLGMQTTGNAGGSHNLIVNSSGEDFEGLLRRMGTGLLVTELLGHGINMVTGDYSRGAAGYWVENGVLQYPVEEITIAGNLLQMFRDIVAIGTDIETRSSRRTGSILISRMTIAGD